MFPQKALNRFRFPRNAGDLKDCNGKGEAGDPKCSDMIEMFVKFENDKVLDAKFLVFGCPGAVSTTDVFIDMIKGKTIEEIHKITEQEISDKLGGLPLEHMHCTNLSMDAFKKAVEDYKKK